MSDAAVLQFPRDRATDGASGLDDWGRDPALVAAVTSWSQLRWATTVGGDQRLPRRGGALLVINARRWSQATVLTSLSIAQAIERPVRFAGRRGTSPLSAVEQRLGGLLERPAEIAGTLRAGELVVIAASPTTGPRSVGTIDHRLVRTAVETKVPIFPTATSSLPLSRRARVEIGAAMRPSSRRRGPLAEYELAARLRTAIGMLLDEMGELETGTPFDWLTADWLSFGTRS
jgi:hypothetical protein